MLKRLLIAVFVLSLILALNGTAFSDVYPKAGEALNPVVKVNPNHARINNVSDARPAQPTFKKSLVDIQKLPTGLSVPAPPLDYFCEFDSYTNGVPFYYWSIPDAFGDDLFNMRFTSETNFDCTLKVAWFLMLGDVMTGTPDMRVYLWDDDGFGFPGVKLDSVDILNASLPTAGLGYVAADFTTTPTAIANGEWVFSDGEEYHLGFTILGGVGDTIAVISDDATGPYAGEERASENWNGFWGTMLNDWGLDVSFFIESEVCCGEIPFTDCYTQAYAQNIAFFWRAPHPTFGDEDYSMRFDVEGPETLVSVDVAVYNDGGSASATGVFGNNDLNIIVYGDAAGLPDESNILASVIVPAGTYPSFPSYLNVPFNLVIDQTFHVSFGSNAVFGSGEYEATLSSDGTDGTMRSASDWGGGSWFTMIDGWGGDYNFLIDANMCRDEYSLCETVSYFDGLAFFWRLPDQYGDVANGMRMTGQGEECRVQEVTWALYDNGSPNAYTNDSKISVYSDGGGIPGVELASITLTPADYVIYPGLMTVDFEPLDVFVTGDYFVTVESFGTDSSDGIRTLSDDGSTPAGTRGVELWNGSWFTMLADWGAEYDFIAYSEHCCVPFNARTCTPGSDPGWSTFQGNQERTGASELAVDDAWCDLNLKFNYLDATNSVSFTGPAIADDMVVCAFTDHFVVFDIVTGGVVYTLTTASGDGQLIGTTNIRSTPTIKDGVMYIAGGSSNGIGAVDFATGAVLWQRTIASVGPTGLFGFTIYTSMTILLDQGGTDVLYYGTDNGSVAAVEAATGNLFAGWATNPVSLTGGCYVSGATDGTNLYYSTQDAGTEGDIYSIDAATGAINWQLSGAGGLQAQAYHAINDPASAYVYPEGFRGGVAYQNGSLFAGSYANDGGASDHPFDGMMYFIDAATGNENIPAVKTNRVIFSTPMVDINTIFMPTLTQWANPTDPTGGAMIAFNRNTGTQVYGHANPAGDRYYTSGVFTCEPDTPVEVDDLIFIANEGGFIQCINSVTGEEVYRRRIDYGVGAGAANIGFGGAMAMADGAVHMAFADFNGGLYVFNKGVDRPRLEIQTYGPTAPVEFGVSPALAVNVGPIIVNTGCVDLNILGTTVDENPITNSTLPAFSASFVTEEVMQRASEIADDLQRNAFLSKYIRPNSNDFSTEADYFSVKNSDRIDNNTRYAAGIPAWFISLDHPTAGDIVAPGDTMDLEITVNQPLITRGPQRVYIAIDSDDPDFFVNVGAPVSPEVLLTIVGGCLIDTTTLTFGAGGANTQLVTNTGRLGTGDWTPHGFEIDGDDASYYQGSYIYGVSTYAIAVNTQDWSGGGGEADAWTSLQADPNYCDTECKPAISTIAVVGSITSDGGLTYDPISADMVCATYLDSVENFDVDPDPLNTVWDWSDFGVKTFDDTLSMGLMVNQRTYGVVDLPQLANLTIAVMDITERNGNPVTDWYLGQVTDYDVGSDSVAFDQSISAAWAHNTPAADGAWGSIKIPFGCGEIGAGQDFDYNPLRSVKGLVGASALFDINAYFDSAYIYLSAPNGTYASQNTSTSDFEMHTTYGAHTFAGSDSYSIGIANFGVAGLTDATSGAELADMAHFVNKFAGFGRGDVNDDAAINLADIVYLAATVNNGGPGAVPFAHISDVNADGAIDAADIAYLIDYYFNCGPCPMGDWVI